MINTVIIDGRLTKDYTNELKTAPKTGTPYVSFSVAVYTGEDRPPMFVNVALFGKPTTYFCQHAIKGALVVIDGYLKPNFVDGKQSSISINARNVDIMTTRNENTAIQGTPATPNVIPDGSFPWDE